MIIIMIGIVFIAVCLFVIVVGSFVAYTGISTDYYNFKWARKLGDKQEVDFWFYLCGYESKGMRRRNAK